MNESIIDKVWAWWNEIDAQSKDAAANNYFQRSAASLTWTEIYKLYTLDHPSN